MGERINKGSMKTWGRGREGEDEEKAKKKGDLAKIMID